MTTDLLNTLYVIVHSSGSADEDLASAEVYPKPF